MWCFRGGGNLTIIFYLVYFWLLMNYFPTSRHLRRLTYNQQPSVSNIVMLISACYSVLLALNILLYVRDNSLNYVTA